jgi:2-polyprenyl-3-methyl-5-hydroxy-6-metoxy-1,4-benzoquinol methylase
VKAKPWSSPKTTERALALLEDLGGLDWKRAKVADVGAGRGWFSRVLSERLRETQGLDPREHVFPCDAAPESFEVDELVCVRTGAGGRLPFEDGSLDAAVSLEVIEHVEDQLGFLKEVARIVKPGGLVVVSTPNVLSLTSRVRTLLWGFPELYDPLPLEGGDPRCLSGHIHPIAPYFLAHAALRAGLVDPSLHPDRTKRSSAVYAVLLAPALFLAQVSHRSRLARKHPDVLAANRKLIAEQSGWSMLTSRTAILSARTPGRRPGEPIGAPR